MATKIQIRRDTAADWTSINPTLAAGEFGWESDTNKFKIGDGATAWTALAYASDGDTAGITFVGDDSTGTLVSQNETFKIAGGTGITTAVSGDTMTITASGGGGTITALNNQAENRLVSIGSTTTELDGEANLTFDGSTLTLTGSAALDGVTITDNTISTNRSNDNLEISANGSGHVFVGDGAISSVSTGNNNGRADRGVTSLHNASIDPSTQTTSSSRYYANTDLFRATLTGNSTDANARWQKHNVMELELNGTSNTATSTLHAPGSRFMQETRVDNNNASAATLGTLNVGQFSATMIASAGDVNLTDVVTNNGVLDSGGSFDKNITNAYIYKATEDTDANTNITNLYGLYLQDTSSTLANITNEWGVYAANDAQKSRLGGVDLQNGDITTGAVSITDNTITTNRSNDSLGIGSNGTGQIILSTTDTFSTSEMTNNRFTYGGNSIDNMRGVNLLYREEDIPEITTDSDRRYIHGLMSEFKLATGINTADTNMRFRNYLGGTALDMNGSSSTNTSLGRGPRAADFQTAVLNSNATTATLGSAVGSGAAIFIQGANSTGDINVTNMASYRGSAEVQSDTGITVAVTNNYGFHSSSSMFGSGTHSITNDYGFYVDSLAGTNKYAFYDNSNSLSVFGDIQTQGVSITDNLITTNRSNDDLLLGTNGTGRINISTDGSNFFTSNPLYETYFGPASFTRTMGISSSETVDANTAARKYVVGVAQNTTLSGSSSTNSNFCPRTLNMANSLDMAGYSFTQASVFRGPIASNFVTNVVNSDTPASTLYHGLGLLAGISAYDEGAYSEGDLTITNAVAIKALVEVGSGGTGSGNFTMTNAYGVRTDALASSGDTITNLYGFYHADTSGQSGTITNEYAFYDASNSLSVFGDIQTQAVSITNNTITSNNTNQTLKIEANGTGQVNLGGDFDNIDSGTRYDNGVNTVYIDSSWDANTRLFANNAGMLVTMTGTGGSNFEYTSENRLTVETDGNSATSDTRGLESKRYATILRNSNATTSTIKNVKGLRSVLELKTDTGDLTATNSYGYVSDILAEPGSGRTATFTDSYNFYAQPVRDLGGGGTTAGTNNYGFYYHTGSVATNNYAFYDGANALSRFGAVILANQASDPSGVTDSSHIYAKDDAGSSEVYVRDEAGNVTKISPHNEAGEWEYYSRNSKTGKTVRINMEKLVAEVEKLSGKTFIENE